MASYMETYKAYRDAFTSKGVDRHLAEKLAKDMAINGGRLSPHLREYAQAILPLLNGKK